MVIPHDRRLLLSVTALGLVASLICKWLADAYLVARVPLIGDVVALTPATNAGIAFGLTFPPITQAFLIGAAAVVVCLLAVRVRRPVEQVGFGLILGGALGNLCDRLFDGLVTDFFQVGSFPVFNLADSCITVGAVVLVLASLKPSRPAGQE